MCTGIRLIADNNAVIYGRTLEFDEPLDSSIVFIPRHISFAGTTLNKKEKGLKWKSLYAALGADISNNMNIIDGVNEKGLAGGFFYFSGYASYQDVVQGEFTDSIAPCELMTWILTTCATVNDVKAKLLNLKVANVIFPDWGIVPPIHAIVHDDAGNSVVIEFTDGKLRFFDNPFGVITNGPTFDWHLTNLTNYPLLDTIAEMPRYLRGAALKAQGASVLGLPGDFSSASRFVRAVCYSQTVIEVKNEKETLVTALHILDLFNIPIGVYCSKEEGVLHCDYTQWTSVVDLKNKRYCFHTYKNRNLRTVDLLKFDLEGKELIVVMSMDE